MSGSGSDEKVANILEVLPQLTPAEAGAIVAQNEDLSDLNDLLAKALEYLGGRQQHQQHANNATDLAADAAALAAPAATPAAAAESERLKRREAKSERMTVEGLEEVQRRLLRLTSSPTAAAGAAAAGADAAAAAAPSQQPDATVEYFRIFNHQLDRRYVAEDSTTLHVRNAECIYLRMLNKFPTLKPYSGPGACDPEVDYKTISSIDYVYNELQEQRFEKKKIEMLSSGRNAEELLLFHGTKHENVNLILRDNFRLDKCRRTAYGPGLYFSEVPAKSLGYGPALILCRVLTGRVQKPKTDQEKFDPGRYDTYQAKELDKTSGVAYIHVVAHPSQVLPYCVYHFEKKTDRWRRLACPDGSSTGSRFSSSAVAGQVDDLVTSLANSHHQEQAQAIGSQNWIPAPAPVGGGQAYSRTRGRPEAADPLRAARLRMWDLHRSSSSGSGAMPPPPPPPPASMLLDPPPLPPPPPPLFGPSLYASTLRSMSSATYGQASSAAATASSTATLTAPSTSTATPTAPSTSTATPTAPSTSTASSILTVPTSAARFNKEKRLWKKYEERFAARRMGQEVERIKKELTKKEEKGAKKKDKSKKKKKAPSCTVTTQDAAAAASAAAGPVAGPSTAAEWRAAARAAWHSGGGGCVVATGASSSSSNNNTNMTADGASASASNVNGNGVLPEVILIDDDDDSTSATAAAVATATACTTDSSSLATAISSETSSLSSSEASLLPSSSSATKRTVGEEEEEEDGKGEKEKRRKRQQGEEENMEG